MRENNAHVAKQIEILKNRLDKALVKFNQALTRNKHLRENIDNLRRERVMFDGIYKKLEKEQLQEKKNEGASIVEMPPAPTYDRCLGTVCPSDWARGSEGATGRAASCVPK